MKWKSTFERNYFVWMNFWNFKDWSWEILILQEYHCLKLCQCYDTKATKFRVTNLNNLNDIPDFPKSHYALWRMQWSYLHIKQSKNISKLKIHFYCFWVKSVVVKGHVAVWFIYFLIIKIASCRKSIWYQEFFRLFILLRG